MQNSGHTRVYQEPLPLYLPTPRHKLNLFSIKQPTKATQTQKSQLFTQTNSMFILLWLQSTSK